MTARPQEGCAWAAVRRRPNGSTYIDETTVRATVLLVQSAIESRYYRGESDPPVVAVVAVVVSAK